MQRKIVGQRLAYYQQAASAEYWDGVWKHNPSSDLYDLAQQGDLGYYQEIFPKYLPKVGRILEAGCGLGQIVIALLQRGYHAEGVEWGHETVERVISKFPNLPIREGDVTRLEVPDNHYAGYISLGVVEHREEGPQVFLKEAHRILDQDGIAFISVPNFHLLRRLKAKLGYYASSEENTTFYQYAFTHQEFAEILHEENFEILERMPYDGYKGTKDELPILKWVFDLPKIGWRIRRFFERSSFVERYFGHMILFVCRKRGMPSA